MTTTIDRLATRRQEHRFVYAQFVQGLSATTNDSVTILSTAGNVVTAQVVAGQSDGTSKTFEGTYTVTGGVITNFAVQQTAETSHIWKDQRQ